MKYLPRIVDSEIKELMKIMGVVSVSGDVKYRISKEYVKALIHEEVKKLMEQKEIRKKCYVF